MDLRILWVFTILITVSSSDLLNQAKKKTVKLSPCEACKKLVESFNKGIERTARGNFAGGDTAWEEEKLGSYHRSEIRLVEIQENLCHDVPESEAQCHSLAEDAESDLETWWFKKQDSDPDLGQWLCFSTMKLCCPSGHYGEECYKCSGYPGNVCSGHGKCKGDGTRGGNGECICHTGYSGKNCSECAINYYQVASDEVISCSPCHISCLSGCSDGTSKGCKACKSGWHMEKGLGCVDIDECKTSKNLCKPNEVCVNSEGTFYCKEVIQGIKDPGKWVRYVTYGSFIIATGLFIRKSTWFGGFVGLLTAVYISASEIVMNDLFDLSALSFQKALNK